MKKVFFIVSIFFVLLLGISISSYAVTLDTIEANLSTNKVEPGKQVTLTITFGQALGAFTFDISYDENLFEYVKSEGATQIDNNGTRVRMTFFDGSGGANPREQATITFKAKENILTSNPTDFSITAEGLANADASIEYDDITTPIKKDILVEPNYVDYNLSLEYEGDIEPTLIKNMKLITESSLGKSYDHVRLIANVVSKPTENATVQLLATDEQEVEHDLIKNGWGNAEGYKIGGKDVRQELMLRSAFSNVGNYTIKISLIDRDNSDTVIASKNFDIRVGGVNNSNEGEPVEPEQEKPEQNKPEEEIQGEVEELPEELPKTGNMKYGYILVIILLGAIIYFSINRKKN